MLALKAFAVWLLILVCAVFNGALREGFLVPHLGQVAALVVSGLVLSLCIVIVAVIFVPWFGPLRTKNYVVLGAFWLGLTLAFEFGFGRVIQHKTWRQLLDAYTFQDGNLWPVVLVITGLAPLLAARLRGLGRAAPPNSRNPSRAR
jgi:hypothetical protein